MCLLDIKRFRFTIFPKKVYKIVNIADNKMFSPYVGIPITKVMEGNGSIKPERFGAYFKFEDGFIHAYIDKKYAYRYLRFAPNRYSNKNVVIKGYIPAFTRYAKGGQEICARKIIFNI